MTIEEIPNYSSFWAWSAIGNKKTLSVYFKDCYGTIYINGRHDNRIPAEDLNFISIIPLPDGFKTKDLEYYG